MKIAGLLIMLLTIFTHTAWSQNTEMQLFLDSRAGYSSNTFLHPFVNEWDSRDSGVYSRLLTAGQLFWNRGDASANLTAGGFYEPIFDNRPNWTGFYGSGNVSYRISQQFSAGMESSVNRLSSEYGRSTYTLMPTLSWSPSLFTKIRARAGSSFRSYFNLQTEEGDQRVSDRFDLYGVEIERWPSLNWRVTGSLFGLMDQNLVENHSLSFSLSRLFRNEASLSLQVSFNQYLNRFLIEGEAGTGGPPFGEPRDGTEDQIVEESDRLLKSGISFQFPVADNLTASASLSHLSFMPGLDDSSMDVELSAGIQYRLSFTDAVKSRGSKLSTDWEERKDGTVILNIRHTGEGDLYITGEFNDWERPGIPLHKVNNRRYAVQLELDPGIYEYKILQKEENEVRWLELSNETMTVDDGFDGENGLIIID